jgi:plastocyanin
VAVALTGTLFYSMLTWTSAGAADKDVNASLGGGFAPDPVTVAPGDSITWKNLDGAAIGNHNLRASGALPVQQGFQGDCNIGPGAECAKQINPVPGSYGYACTIHPTMTGTITVSLMGGGGSPSGSASGSASPSPSASATPSGSPSPSPSASPSPSPSPTPEPAEIERTVSLNLKEHLKASGRVKAPDDGSDACITNIKVTVQKKKKGKGWKNVESDRTNADGKYSVGIPDKEGKYRASIGTDVSGQLICNKAKSDSEKHKHGNGRRR